MSLFNKSLSDLWKNHRIFLIIFGVVIIAIKFSSFFIDLLVSDSNKIVNDTVKKDADLKSQQDHANNEANRLIEESKKMEENKSDVDSDWHKK